MIETLLTNITNIRGENEVRNKAEGNDFNIFSVLKITTDEVRLHSRFLAELLNPKGSHGQGTFFLQQFLNTIHQETIFPDFNKVEVFVEYYIGQKTENTGGKIDLLLRDNLNNLIIIENKIHAIDQENQLLRYYNFGKFVKLNGNDESKFILVYLTLLGENANETSHGTDGISINDYLTISYIETIYSWLEKCLHKVDAIPKIKVGIEHYIQLIGDLTGKETNIKMNYMISEQIIQNAATFESAEAISGSLLSAKVTLLSRIGEKLKNQILASRIGINSIALSADFGKKWQGLEMFLTESENDFNNRPAHIRISFLREANDCYIEIHPGVTNGNNNDKNHEKRKKYESLLNEYFNSNNAKVVNTEKYWQGEWVCYYSKLNNRFSDIINDQESVVIDIMRDLEYLINAFIKIEQGNY